MKRQTSLLAFLLLLTCCMYGQKTKLPDSKRFSEKAHIYKISPENLRLLYVNDKPFSEQMLGEKIAEYPNHTTHPKLVRGNYLILSSSQNQLNITDYTEDNFYYKIIPSEGFMIYLYDSLGNTIKDASVKCHSKVLKFNTLLNAYETTKIKGKKVIEINNHGVFHYIDVEQQADRRRIRHVNIFKQMKWTWKRTWIKTKQFAINILDPQEPSYKGFVVFSKPKYKPGETVKLKAYVAEKNGKPYKKPLDLALEGGYGDKVDTTLAHLASYRPGMFEYQFKLSDSLHLTLDKNYRIVFRKDNENETISDRFRYEDYELKDVRFKMNIDKMAFSKNDSIKLKFKATDENDMARFGGKVDVVVTPKHNTVKTEGSDRAFVPDTLWTHTLPMDGESEKELVIPDSIFPKNVSFNYVVKSTYTSDDNQKRTSSQTLQRNFTDYNLDFSLKNGMMKIQEMFQGKPHPTKARIEYKGENDELLNDKEVNLPFETTLPWYVNEIYVETKECRHSELVEDISSSKQVDCLFYTDKDSLRLELKNPANIPIWFTILNNKKSIYKGFCNQDYVYKKKIGRKDAFNLKLTYLYASAKQSIDEEISRFDKNLSMKVATPTSVYPGQKTNVAISVTDNNGKPVKNVDITAYSFTSKFEQAGIPRNILVYGKSRTSRSFQEKKYDVDEAGFTNKRLPLDWEKWKGKMSLDTISYYRFLYPKTFFCYTEPTDDYSTQVSPYVVVDGAIQPIHAIWIDGRTVYVAQAQQLDAYSFRVSPGKHDFRFRTSDRIVSVSNVYLAVGARNILSFDVSSVFWKEENPADKLAPCLMTSRLMDKKLKNQLSDDELKQLSSDMITVDNNFGYISFQNINKVVQLPGYIKSGNQFFYLNNTKRNDYNSVLRGYTNSDILAGPFPERGFVNGQANMASAFADGKFLTYFQVEGGNRYTFMDRYQKIQSWGDSPLSKNYSPAIPEHTFRAKPISLETIQNNFNGRIHSLLSNSSGIARKKDDALKELNRSSSKLELLLGKDKTGKELIPSLIYIQAASNSLVYKDELYYGGTRDFRNIPAGTVNLYLIFKDSTIVSKSIEMKLGGQNYLKFDSVEYAHNTAIAETAFKKLEAAIQKITDYNPYISPEFLTKESPSYAPPVTPSVDITGHSVDGLVSGIVVDNTGEPLIGVSVKLRNTSTGVITGLNGQFTIAVPKSCELIVSLIGCEPQTFKAISGKEYKITLREDKRMLNEVVVIGYGTAVKRVMTGAVTNVSETLQGRVSGVSGASKEISIRGISSMNENEQPLIIVDGLPYDGKMEDLNSNDIISFNILKDAATIGLYGARAKYGVIMVQTKGFKDKVDKALSEEGADIPGNSIRKNFHDDAFWQPRLTTDKQGKASFEVTYPDDITTWNAHFIAIGGKRMADKQQLSIRSFKALTARLSLPRFAIRGDEFNAAGRISNYLGDSISLIRSYTSNNRTAANDLKIRTNYIDNIPTKATDGDSLSISYSIKSPNGFVDGEERSLPIYEKGMLQTYGNFQVLNDTLVHKLKSDPDLGDVTIHAEASSFALFLDEIEKVEKYKYLCNEQMASKVKALLSQKRLYKLLGKDFRNESKLKELIQKLNKNKNKVGLWGWWNNSGSVFWVSKQVISAMLDAEDAGYKTDFDRETLAKYYQQELDGGLASLKTASTNKLPYAKGELFDRLLLLKRLNAPIDFEGYFKQVNLLKSHSLSDKLRSFQVMATIGLQNQIPIDSLMKYSRHTLLGSLYWTNQDYANFRFEIPYENNTEYTLMAYSIFKNMGNKQAELQKIRNYFFEIRHNGQWPNTYESTRIMETILPDLLDENQSLKDVCLDVNGQLIKKFPYTETLKIAGKEIEIQKRGTAPVFITSYQQAWNPDPKIENKKGFAMQSYFADNNDTVSVLKAGKAVTLKVSVDVKADAQYVQIEIPIPAGCSYETKPNSYWSVSHSEYFKDRVVIFCDKLNKGNHLFNIELNPRFTGKYTLNPAKAELMYFPTFYGNEKVKILEIR